MVYLRMAECSRMDAALSREFEKKVRNRMEEYLIKNTTKTQREQIVKDALGYGEVGCDEAAGSYGYDMYQDYIDGIREIDEITRSFRTAYVHGDMDRPERSACGYQK